MSWSYSGNPGKDPIDAIRFKTGDTNINEQIMQDEEIQFLIDEYGFNNDVLLYHAFSQMATLFAREIKRSLGPQSEDPTDRLDFFKSKADYYKSKTSSAGLSQPKYCHPKIFSIGMQNNPPWNCKSRGV